ncbi:hypothetical protein TNCV_1298681 [Trichonephila clavipes]|nr:hypothetical protein TNCV_1298681 [Trichonephila clavipes]
MSISDGPGNLEHRLLTRMTSVSHTPTPKYDIMPMVGLWATAYLTCLIPSSRTTTASSDVVQYGRPIFDDFFQHLWPSIGNHTANVVFQMVKRLWLIHIDQ